MKTFPQAFIENVNALYDGGKLILLAEIDLDSATTRYYCSHEEAVTFGGQSYDPLPMLFDEYSTNNKGELPSMKVSISNIGNEALEILETYNVLEKTVVLRIVNLKVLDDSTAQDTTELMIISVSTSDNGIASFILGLPIATDEEVPRERFNTQDFPGIPKETATFGI
ncbi:MAG: hypothetical protein GY821_12595 [Gammaproteobacteria bacterium]|nr:hypothetical protein [Gammaproteobacteria bacterium]